MSYVEGNFILKDATAKQIAATRVYLHCWAFVGLVNGLYHASIGAWFWVFGVVSISVVFAFLLELSPTIACKLLNRWLKNRAIYFLANLFVWCFIFSSSLEGVSPPSLSLSFAHILQIRGYRIS